MYITDTHTVASARKHHQCCWCAEPIECGTSYQHYLFVDGGDASNLKFHLECYAAMTKAADEAQDMIEWNIGDNRRGCNCWKNQDCELCASKTTVN